MSITIDADDPTDRWRFTCPNNHRSWEPTNGGIYCTACSRQVDPGDGPVYHALLDQRTGELVAWSDVCLRWR